MYLISSCVGSCHSLCSIYTTSNSNNDIQTEKTSKIDKNNTKNMIVERETEKKKYTGLIMNESKR